MGATSYRVQMPDVSICRRPGAASIDATVAAGARGAPLSGDGGTVDQQVRRPTVRQQLRCGLPIQVGELDHAGDTFVAQLCRGARG